MTALACIRVFIGADLSADKLETLAPLVARVGTSFLEGRWRWPRQHAVAAPFAFVLADPRVERLDTNDLTALSAELQHKLFGDQGAGEVCLLMLEGDKAEIQRFAAAGRETLAALLLGQDVGLSGRLSEVRPDGIRILLPESERTPGAAPLDRALRLAPQEAVTAPVIVWRGIYNTVRRAFIGSAIANREQTGPMTEDQCLMLDIEGLLTASRALRQLPTGVLFCPISYSCLLRPSLRDQYLPILDRLEPDDRARLALTVYDVPRSPSFTAMQQIKALTSPFFGFTDLQVIDPEFAVGALPRGSVSSVTFCLPPGDRRDRLKAMRLFQSKAADYRKVGIWQALADVAAPELLAFTESPTPFISGPAVSDLLKTPVGGCQAPRERLPYRETISHPTRRLEFAV